MANTITLDIVINQAGIPVGRITRDLNSLGEARRKNTKATRDATTAQAEHDYKQSQGIRGTAAAGRSMSKLTQTIGSGPNSLVGAYATLAANVFAVGEAFNALRNAAQVSQVLAGLELQGARTGRALTLTAQGIQDITRGALSASESMQAAALGTSAGLSRKDLEDLTKVATNASLVLGRNLPDSMDRVIKGVTKLEPELLDELGLMTKLTEATEMYARENGKAASSLTNFEKRRAFVEAIKKEGALKYEGVSEELGVNRLDQLAAAFENLKHSTLGAVATSDTMNAILTVLIDTSYGLVGALTLFGSYIGSKLTSYLHGMAASSMNASKALRATAVALREKTTAAIGATKATMDLAAADTKVAAGLRNRAAKKLDPLVAKAQTTGLTAQEQATAIKLLDSSTATYTKTIEKNTAAAAAGDAAAMRKLVNAIEQKAANDLLRDSLIRLTAAQDAHNLSVQKNAASILLARSASAGQASQRLAAGALEAAGGGKLGTAFNKAYDSIALYRRQLDRAAAAAATTTTSTSNLTRATLALGPAMRAGQTALYGATLGVKLLGVTISTILPWIGTLTIAFSIGQAIYEKFFVSEETKKKAKALAELGTVLDSVGKSIKEFTKLQTSANQTVGGTALKSITIQANAMNELIDAYLTATEVYVSYAETRQVASQKFSPEQQEALKAAALRKELEITSDAAVNLASKLRGWWANIPIIGSIFDSFSEEDKTLIKMQDALSNLNPELAKNLNLTGDVQKDTITLRSALQLSQKAWKDSQLAVENYTSSLASVEQAQAEFSRSLKTTTKYDAVIDAFTSLNNSFKELQEVSERGITLDPNKIVESIAAIGPNIRNLLPLDEQLKLSEAESKQKSINYLNAELLQLTNKNLQNTEQYRRVQDQIYKLQGEQKAIIFNVSPEIIKTTQALEESYRLDRLRTLSLQGQVVLEQARLEKIQRGGTIVASDLVRQIDSQNKLKDLQAQQLEIELNRQLAEISISEQRLNQLNTKIKDLENGKEALMQLDEMKKKELEIQKVHIQNQKASAAFFYQGADLEKANTMYDQQIQTIDVQLSPLTESDEAKKNRLKEYKEEKQQQEKAIELARAQIKLARDQITAIRSGIIAANEKNLMAQELTIQNGSKVLQNSLAIRKTEAETRNVTQEINDTLLGRNSSLERELKLIKQQAQEKQADLQAQAAATIAELERSKELAKVRGLNDQVKEYETRIDLAEREYNASVRLEESKARLAIIQKAISVSIEDSIRNQQDGLNVLQRQYDLSKTILDSQLEIERANARIAAKRFGADIDPITEQVLAKRAAEAEYQAALNGYKLRLAAIDAEYDLLEAQRLTQVGAIKASIMLTEAVLKANGGITESQQKTLDASKAAANTLERQSYETARNQAKEVERLGIEKLRLAKEEASIFTAGPGSALLGAISNLGVIFSSLPQMESIPEANYESPGIKAIEETNKAQLEGLKSVIDEITNGKFSEIPSTLREIVDVLRETKNSRDVENKVPSSNISDLAKYVESQYSGAKVSEMAGFGMEKNPTSGHGKNSLHYSGQAFDVNMVSGEDAKNPRAKDALDKMAKDLSKRGLEVLWNGFIYQSGKAVAKIKDGEDQHTDHLHAEVMKRASQVVSKSIETIESATVEAVKFTKANPSPSTLRMRDNTAAISNSGRNLVANDNDVPDLGDFTVKTGAKIQVIQSSILGLKPTIEQLGLALASVFGGFNSDLDRLSVNLDEVGKAQVEVLKAGTQLIANLAISIPQTLGLLNTSYKEYKTKMSDVNTKLVESGKEQIKIMDQGQYQAAQLSSAFSATAQAIGGVISLLQAASNAKIAVIDKEIAAEERRDGKSAASVAKLDALEKKKDNMARKAFNTNKKLMMAQAVMSTAAGIAGALGSNPGITGIILAGIIGAMGAAQIAVIAGTQYESSYSPKAASMPSSLSIGKRGDTVDLAKGPNMNAGGEVGYLRGAQGTGTNATNYNTVGSAYGGDLLRGYGNRGFVVGEKGPERIDMDTPITVTPANDTNAQTPVNANITIQALDSSDVQRVLVDQRGNIIQMLREAANASGQRFLEDVNVSVYTRPSVNKL